MHIDFGLFNFTNDKKLNVKYKIQGTTIID